MSRRYELYHVDAFTATQFTGNSAGVVLNANGLSASEMHEIAAELRHSETAFVFEPEGDDHDVIVRFFTPLIEVPSCGHATIASQYARALKLGIRKGKVLQKCGAGILPIDLEPEDGDIRVRMHQNKAKFERELDPAETSAVISALGVGAGDRNPECPVEIVNTGHAKVLLGVRNNEVLNGIVPDNAALSKVSADIGCNGFHVFTLATDQKDVLTECRMFAPAIGIDEDPVTGNGNGPLGAYLVKHGLAAHDDGVFRFDSLQGRAMGRPGVARVEVTIEDGKPAGITVSGRAVVVFQAELSL